jgi:hypothetical protein
LELDADNIDDNVPNKLPEKETQVTSPAVKMEFAFCHLFFKGRNKEKDMFRLDGGLF